MATYHPHHLLPPTPSPSNTHHAHPTSLLFDPYADLLWQASSSGHVQSFHSPHAFARNVAFPAAGILQGRTGGSGVREMWIGEREIVTLGERGLGGRKRGGLVKWSVREGATSLSTMCPSPTNTSELIAGGAQPKLLIVNTQTGSLVRQVDSLSNLLFLRQTPRFVASGSADGLVRFHDPRTGMKAENSLSAHLGGLTGLETAGWNVLTMGYTVKQGHPLPDPMVKIYDVRTFKPLPSVTFPAGPAFVLAHPKNPSSLVVASAQGMFQTTDLNKPGEASFHQLDMTSYLTAAAISASGSYLAFGDSEGSTHIWSSADTSAEGDASTFNGYTGVEVDWADSVEPLPQIHWSPDTPLNLIGMPHYSTPLLSNVPDKIYCPPTSSPFFHPPPKIPSSVTQSIRTVDFVGYSQCPRELKGTRNKITAGRKNGILGAGKRRTSEPRFRSEREREKLKAQKGGVKVGEAVGADGTEGKKNDEDEDEPEMGKYRKVEIKYSKFGVEDFDFGFYNSTRYSGLETHIANSYTNSILQALHYTLPFRSVAKSHLSTHCTKENCLLCEAGFLFRMLEDAQGTNCQATNFSRAFSGTPQANALNLLDSEDSPPPRSYSPLVQAFTRFILDLMSTEATTYASNPILLPLPILPPSPLLPTAPSADKNSTSAPKTTPSVVSQVLGMNLKHTVTCLACGSRSSRASTVHTVDLVYPRKALSNESPQPTTFPSLLHASIARDQTTKAVCSHCKQYAPLRNRRVLTSHAILPSVLTINAAVHSPEQFDEFWLEKPAWGAKRNPFLPKKFGVLPDGEGGEDFKIVGEEGKGKSWKEGTAVYELRALVVEINSGTDEQHLVSIVKIPVDELEPDATSPWFVFNDFLISNVSEEEALSFPDDWKTPAVMVYERTDSHSPLDLSSLPMGIDPSILSRDVSLAWNRDPSLIKHHNLTQDELPEPGTLVAIDAEFVAMQLDDYEYRSDGTKKVVRPSRLSLARVSVLRGSGDREESPFIDDHIHTSEPVVDYLTDFSGIHNGDLDIPHSRHTLVPLKVAYKKLRLLVDLGCVFIGHGLKKDFRIINIFVPPSQVLDTVDLYYNPSRQRKMSLRFLAWLLLKNDIQMGEHDSIEDARSALQLYKMYLRFMEDDRLDDVMDDIFAEGKRLNWKPPGTAVAPFDPSTTPLSRSAAPTPEPASPLRPMPHSQIPHLGGPTSSHYASQQQQQQQQQQTYSLPIPFAPQPVAAYSQSPQQHHHLLNPLHHHSSQPHSHVPSQPSPLSHHASHYPSGVVNVSSPQQQQPSHPPPPAQSYSSLFYNSSASPSSSTSSPTSNATTTTTTTTPTGNASTNRSVIITSNSPNSLRSVLSSPLASTSPSSSSRLPNGPPFPSRPSSHLPSLQPPSSSSSTTSFTSPASPSSTSASASTTSPLTSTSTLISLGRKGSTSSSSLPSPAPSSSSSSAAAVATAASGSTYQPLSLSLASVLSASPFIPSSSTLSTGSTTTTMTTGAAAAAGVGTGTTRAWTLNPLPPLPPPSSSSSSSSSAVAVVAPTNASGSASTNGLVGQHQQQQQQQAWGPGSGGGLAWQQRRG